MLKRLALLAAFLAAAPVMAAEDNILGTIVATASTNNLTTATPFTVPIGAFVSIQCNGDFNVTEGPSSSVTATATNGYRILSQQIFDIGFIVYSGQVIAVLPVSGTITCLVGAKAP